MSAPAATPRPTIATPRPQGPRPQYLELRANVHRKLLNRLNLEALAQTERSRAEGEIRSLLGQLLTEEATPISLTEREQLFAEILDDVFGLGPLEPLLRDPSVNDILVNTYKQVFVERKGVLERVSATFQDDRHLLRVIDRIVSSVGRRIDDSSPMVDARLADGSRVNAIVPPLAVDGPLLSIRRFPAERLQANDLVNFKALTAPMLNFLAACVKGRLNCLISGGTGAGKTTLLNGSSRLKTPLNCSSVRSTWRGWKPARPTSKARARSSSGSSSSTPCVCGPIASSSARSAARKRSTCSRR